MMPLGYFLVYSLVSSIQGSPAQPGQWEDEYARALDSAPAVGYANLGVGGVQFFFNGLLKTTEMAFAHNPSPSSEEMRDIKRRLSKTTYRQLQDELGITNAIKFVIEESDTGTLKKLDCIGCKYCINSQKPHSLLIANHIFQWDFVPLLRLMDKFGVIERISFVLASDLKNMPFFGWAMAQNNYIFVGKNWERDRETLRKGTNEFKYGPPGVLAIFPEGTVRSPKRAQISRDFARSNKISGFENARHVLVPKAKGLYSLLKDLDPTVDGIFDVTIAASGYCSECPKEDFSIANLVINPEKRPKEVQVAVKFIPIEEIRGAMKSYETFKDWLLRRFVVKNEMLDRYEREGRLFERMKFI